MIDRREIGRITESIAATYLQQQGYQIIERNFSNKFGEIDLIAIDREVLVFVEVKAKTGEKYGLPEEMISQNKLAKVRRMGLLYMGDRLVSCRIDVVAIVLNQAKSVERITVYQNVY